LDDEYINIANKRIYDYLNNNLKIRPLGKPVHKPTGREKVSQIPLSWVKNAA
jgi:site-specific DNA-methyltransferase (adenine-specific)/adenine-specific DNA-methyltransferase